MKNNYLYKYYKNIIMGILLSKVNTVKNLNEFNLLKLENDNLKKKNKSIEKYITILETDLNQIKQDYQDLIIKISNLIK